MNKQPLNIDQVLSLIRTAVAPYPKAAMFELAEQGYSAPFEQLIACTFHERKAAQIQAIARQVVEQYGGELPSYLPCRYPIGTHRAGFHASSS